MRVTTGPCGRVNLAAALMAEKSRVFLRGSRVIAPFARVCRLRSALSPFKRPTVSLSHLSPCIPLSLFSPTVQPTNHAMSSHPSHTSSPSEPSHSPQDPGQSGSKDDPKPDGTARKRRKVTRSRAGCLTCRKRRKLCDMAKPDCGACERLRMVCLPMSRAGPFSHGRNVCGLRCEASARANSRHRSNVRQHQHRRRHRPWSSCRPPGRRRRYRCRTSTGGSRTIPLRTVSTRPSSLSNKPPSRPSCRPWMG